ncbi:MAG: GGDEF domain-containing protein [Ruminiclostridium sp.]|nr:GGDEF domain-containing protein [Ruminiclostridium sp.]
MINGYKIAAVCTAQINNEYVCSYINEFNNVLSENGWRVFVYTVNSDLFHKTRSDRGEASVFDLINYENTDAVVVFPNNLHDSDVKEGIIRRARQAGSRIIITDNPSYSDCINMLFDYGSGFRSIVRHVLDDHKVRNIRMIAGTKGNEASEERIDIVKELAAERGIEFDENHISYGDFWSQPAAAACEELLSRGKLPEAIICANDAMAIAVCGTLRTHGIKVPEDVLVTGFDGIEETKYTSPRISTVKCDFGKLGRASAQALIDGCENGSSFYIMPDLVLSESCGCIMPSANDVSDVVTSYWNMFDRYRNDERKLNNISAMVQGCECIDEAERVLTDHVFYELTCVLKKECTDPTYDPTVVNTDTPFGRDMVVLLDTDNPFIGRDRNMDISQIIPRLDMALEMKVPLIFTAMHCIDIPLGYICFFYQSPSKEEYNKIGQTSGYLSTAIAGLRSMRYQNRLREWIEEVYKYDELTGLYTRKSFVREYEKMLEDGKCTEMTFVLCDLDGLKYINDNFGHAEGDTAIRVVAKAMELACSDGICSKHGGDELLAAIPRICDKEELKYRIERFIADYNECAVKPYEVSSSIGIFTAKGGDLSFDKLFAEADDLMYTDKVRKKNTRSSVCSGQRNAGQKRTE